MIQQIQYSLSHILNLKSDNDGRLNTKLYDKRDDLSFKITNFPAALAYGVYISQLISVLWLVFPIYHDFLDIGLLLTRKGSKQ